MTPFYSFDQAMIPLMYNHWSPRNFRILTQSNTPLFITSLLSVHHLSTKHDLYLIKHLQPAVPLISPSRTHTCPISRMPLSPLREGFPERYVFHMDNQRDYRHAMPRPLASLPSAIRSVSCHALCTIPRNPKRGYM